MEEEKKLKLQMQKLELEVKHLSSGWERWTAKYVPLITVFIAVSVLWWNVHQFNAQQTEERTWKKAEFLTKTVTDFDSTPRVQNAKLMMDSVRLYPNGRKIKLFPDEPDPNRAYRMVTLEDIYEALAVDKTQIVASEEKKEELTAISDCFDVFLSGLEDFDHYIESGLFTADELRRDLVYWLDILAGENIKLNDTRFRARVLLYAKTFGFDGTENLLRIYGYLPSSKQPVREWTW